MNTVTVKGLTRAECAIVVVMDALRELEEADYIEGGGHRISAQGRETARMLREAGFEFNPGEMEEITSWVLANA
jgi:hypothetical protein